MSSASSTATSPDVPQSVPSQASSTSSASSQSVSARPSAEPDAPTTRLSRLKEHSHWARRATRAWLAPAPAAKIGRAHV